MQARPSVSAETINQMRKQRFRVKGGLGFRVWVQGLGFFGLGFRVWVQGLGFIGLRARESDL